jgi:lactate racemase
MKTVEFNFGSKRVPINFPDKTEVLTMAPPKPLSNPAEEVRYSLNNSIGTKGLDQIIEEKLQQKKGIKTVIVISDNTRPVPYRGDAGILWPIICKLLDHGISKENILILVATGTHHSLSKAELMEMLEPKIFELDIPIKNHDCLNQDNLIYLGETQRGTKILVNHDYFQADLKILTGLVESHFMAGASGGRKSVCPGLIGEESTYVFHGARMLASPLARDLVLEGNPCHEEALEVAKKAGVDYIVNVTLDDQFRITGVFSGDLEKAHFQAVEWAKKSVSIKLDREYDIVVTHAGFVGINHYQAAKAGVVAIPALKPFGRLIMVANNTDTNPIGSQNYQTVLNLLKLIGTERFNRLLLSPDWTFIPEQWQVQMWAKLFAKIPQGKFFYYSPQLSQSDYKIIPCVDGNLLLPDKKRYQGTIDDVARFIELAVRKNIDELTADQKEIHIACLADGPYGIPIMQPLEC